MLFAKIGFEDACLDGVARLQLVGERQQTVFTTGGEDQLAAAGGESFGIDRADTRGRAGDKKLCAMVGS